MANTVTAQRFRQKLISRIHSRAASHHYDQQVSCVTWVRGRDDGTKEKAVGVVELVSELSDHLHQLDHAVHQVPADGGRETRDPQAHNRSITKSLISNRHVVKADSGKLTQ